MLKCNDLTLSWSLFSFSLSLYPPLPPQRKCEQYWADNIGEDYQTPDKKLNITTTSVMPYADFSIRTFSVKSVSFHSTLTRACQCFENM